MLDLLSHIAGANNDLANPETAELLEDPLKERLTSDISQHLRTVRHRRAKSGSKTTSENNPGNLTYHSYTFLIGLRFNMRYPLISSWIPYERDLFASNPASRSRWFETM